MTIINDFREKVAATVTVATMTTTMMGTVQWQNMMLLKQPETEHYGRIASVLVEERNRKDSQCCKKCNKNAPSEDKSRCLKQKKMWKAKCFGCLLWRTSGGRNLIKLVLNRKWAKFSDIAMFYFHSRNYHKIFGTRLVWRQRLAWWLLNILYDFNIELI